AFKMKIPADWKLHKRTEYGEDQARISWDYLSPKRNYKLRISVSKEHRLPFAKLSEKAVDRLLRRADDIEIVQKSNDKHQRHPVSSVIAKALTTRNKPQQPYVIYKLLKHMQKSVVAVTVAASGEKLEEFLAIARAIVDSMDLHEPQGVFAQASAQAAARAK